jgi:hypothetical protein
MGHLSLHRLCFPADAASYPFNSQALNGAASANSIAHGWSPIVSCITLSKSTSTLQWGPAFLNPQPGNHFCSSSATRQYQAIARASAKANEPYESYLQRLAEIEVQHRQTQAIARRLKQANFPMVKELEGFDFKTVPQINKKQIIDLSMCGFIDKRSNIVFTGPPGVGKSHLSIALGREACRRGYKVRFFTASELVNTYIEALAEKTVRGVRCV